MKTQVSRPIQEPESDNLLHVELSPPRLFCRYLNRMDLAACNLSAQYEGKAGDCESGGFSLTVFNVFSAK